MTSHEARSMLRFQRRLIRSLLSTATKPPKGHATWVPTTLDELTRDDYPEIQGRSKYWYVSRRRNPRNSDYGMFSAMLPKTRHRGPKDLGNFPTEDEAALAVLAGFTAENQGETK